jgi:hypothetical protein
MPSKSELLKKSHLYEILYESGCSEQICFVNCRKLKFTNIATSQYKFFLAHAQNIFILRIS